MKTLTLRLSDADHASLSELSAAQRMSMAALLMSLFDKHLAAQKAQHSSTPAPRLNKRDQAFAEYNDLMANLPAQWTQELFDSTRKAINDLRTQGGNVSHTDMPLPASMVEWNNSQHTNMADTKYADWSVSQLRDEVAATGNPSAQFYLTVKMQGLE